MTLRFSGALMLLGLLLPQLAGCSQPAKSSLRSTVPFQWTYTTLDGLEQVMTPGPETKAVVFEFLSTECPIANRFQPELKRLDLEFSPQGVRFVSIYPNLGETAEGIRQHRAEAAFSGEAGRDLRQELVNRWNITVTPEVVVLAADGALIYRGRVNDQYAGLGQGKPAPTRHDLEESLREYLARGVAKGISTTPVGCRIQREP